MVPGFTQPELLANVPPDLLLAVAVLVPGRAELVLLAGAAAAAAGHEAKVLGQTVENLCGAAGAQPGDDPGRRAQAAGALTAQCALTLWIAVIEECFSPGIHHTA